MFIEISKMRPGFVFVVAILLAPGSVLADFDEDPYAGTEAAKEEVKEEANKEVIEIAEEYAKETEEDEEDDEIEDEEVDTEQVGRPGPSEVVLEDPDYPKIPAKFHCEMVSEKGETFARRKHEKDKFSVRKQAKHRSRSVHFGLSGGYTWYWFRHLLNLTPMLEIRLFKPENSLFKTRDVVLRIGLRMDLMPWVTNPSSQYETETEYHMILMLGPEAGVRMYWPGEKRSPGAMLFHGPFVALQYALYKSRIEDEVDKSYHTALLRVGYEFGVMFFRFLQLSARFELAQFFLPNFGFNAALVY